MFGKMLSLFLFLLPVTTATRRWEHLLPNPSPRRTSSPRTWQILQCCTCKLAHFHTEFRCLGCNQWEREKLVHLSRFTDQFKAKAVENKVRKSSALTVVQGGNIVLHRRGNHLTSIVLTHPVSFRRDSPKVSRPTLPALPTICFHWPWVNRFLPMKGDLKMTLLAGKFNPPPKWRCMRGHPGSEQIRPLYLCFTALTHYHCL